MVRFAQPTILIFSTFLMQSDVLQHGLHFIVHELGKEKSQIFFQPLKSLCMVCGLICLESCKLNHFLRCHFYLIIWDYCGRYYQSDWELFVQNKHIPSPVLHMFLSCYPFYSLLSCSDRSFRGCFRHGQSRDEYSNYNVDFVVLKILSLRIFMLEFVKLLWSFS